MDIKYKSIFAQIKNEHNETKSLLGNRDKDSDVLVVDGTNNFIRCWTVVPTLSDNGDHIGGASGFLTSLGYAIKLLKPTRVIVVFDGKGGSVRRQQLFPGYKGKRKPLSRVNRAYADMTDAETEKKEMLAQMGKLIEYLRCLPVSVVCVDYIEADDAIGYIATQMFPKGKITIMSGDKDFLQLVNTRVSVWSPIKKKIYSVQDIINQYGVHPTNFIYYRILEGDESDNIGGVKGIALKTAIKMFPAITEEAEYSVEKMLLHARDKANEGKKYSSVIDQAEIVSRNYQLMQLKTPDFNGALQMKIVDTANNIFAYNKFVFIQTLTKYGMHSAIPNYHIWLQEVFHPLSVLATS